MRMTGGEIAALIAAVAFAVMVAAIVFLLLKVSKVVGKLDTTVDEANKSLSTITKDADHLLVEVEGLLNKSNTTLDDVNGKLGMTDPLFQAVGDLGVTVSDLNDSAVNLASSVTNFTKRGTQAAVIKKAGESVSRLGRS